VVSDCSYGPKEIVSAGVSGLVVPVDDVGGTRRAIDPVLGTPTLSARLIAAGKQRARDFDVPVIVKRYETLFEELAGELA
jgi:glycosyltransferase involved in cell wall biosynthesis